MSATGVAQPRGVPLAEPPLGETEPLWIAHARSLRKSKRLSYQAIADMLGKSQRQVYVALNPRRKAETDRVSDRRNRAKRTAVRRARLRKIAPPCPRCGQPMGQPTKGEPTQCQKCRHEIHEHRTAVVLELWPTGMTCDAIGERLGISGQHVSAIAHRARQRGHNLQHRPPGGVK